MVKAISAGLEPRDWAEETATPPLGGNFSLLEVSHLT